VDEVKDADPESWVESEHGARFVERLLTLAGTAGSAAWISWNG